MKSGNRTQFQTMLNLSAIIIKKETYPNGVMIALLSKGSYDGCYTESTLKNLNITPTAKKAEKYHVSIDALKFLSCKYNIDFNAG